MKNYDPYTDLNSPSGMTENPSTCRLPGRRPAKGTTSRRRGWAAWARTALPPFIQVPFTKQRPPPKAARAPGVPSHGPGCSPRWRQQGKTRGRSTARLGPQGCQGSRPPTPETKGSCEAALTQGRQMRASACSDGAARSRGLIRPRPRAHQQQRAERGVRGWFSRARGRQRCEELPRTCFSPHSPIRRVLP